MLKTGTYILPQNLDVGIRLHAGEEINICRIDNEHKTVFFYYHDHYLRWDSDEIKRTLFGTCPYSLFYI